MLTDEPWYDSYERLTNPINLCACGNPDFVLDAVARYLTLISPRDEPDCDWHKVHKTVEAAFATKLELALLEHIADAAELTEHGGNVAGAWLTDAGHAWLTEYASYQRQLAASEN